MNSVSQHQLVQISCCHVELPQLFSLFVCSFQSIRGFVMQSDVPKELAAEENLFAIRIENQSI